MTVAVTNGCARTAEKAFDAWRDSKQQKDPREHTQQEKRQKREEAGKEKWKGSGKKAEAKTGIWISSMFCASHTMPRFT